MISRRNQSMDSMNSAGEYSMPPCSAAGYQAADAATKSTLPTLEDIASYSYMNPLQKQQQRQQLQSGGQPFPGIPTSQAGSAMTQRSGQPFPGIPAQQPASGAMPQLTPQQSAALTPVTSAPMIGTAQTGMVTAESLQYLNGFLRTQIGRPVLVDFLIGTNTLVDKSGTLLGVGINYILIREAETDDLLACDFYNIKFIKFYY